MAAGFCKALSHGARFSDRVRQNMYILPSAPQDPGTVANMEWDSASRKTGQTRADLSSHDSGPYRRSLCGNLPVLTQWIKLLLQDIDGNISANL